MKILTVSNYFSGHGGGIEIVAGNLANTMAALGLQVSWAAFGSGMPATSQVRLLPLRGTNVLEKKTGIPYPVLAPGSAADLRREVAQCDIVHLHDSIYESSRIAARAAFRLGKPVVVTQHIGDLPLKGLHHKILYAFANSFFTRPMLRRADKVVFISENVRRFYADCFSGERRPEIIFNGIDPALFGWREEQQTARQALGLDSKAKVGLFIGRFVEKKGLHRIRELATSRPEVQWILIGRGPVAPGSWGLPNVRVIGQIPQSQISRWLAAADLFVLLSTGEGFPLVVQEALVSGCPALVSDEIASACPLIAPRVQTTAPDFSDMQAAFGKALATVPESTEARRERAAFFSDKWSWQGCASGYLALYEKLLSRKVP